METGIRVEIPTMSIFSEGEIVDFLNSCSQRVVNAIGGTSTVWHFDDSKNEIMTILKKKCKEKGIPFTIFSNSDDSIIDSFKNGN